MFANLEKNIALNPDTMLMALAFFTIAITCLCISIRHAKFNVWALLLGVIIISTSMLFPADEDIFIDYFSRKENVPLEYLLAIAGLVILSIISIRTCRSQKTKPPLKL